MPQKPYRPTFRDMMVNNGKWYGDHPAYVQAGRQITFGEYLGQSRRLASALHRAGMRRQDRLGMLGLNSIEYCIMYGACQLTGYIASTVNFRLAAPEMEYVIGNSGQKVLIFETAFSGSIDSIRERLGTVSLFVAVGPDCPEWAVSWNDFLATGDPKDEDPPHPSPDDVAYLMYTSGTTGKPKGVMQEHHAQIENAKFVDIAYQLGHRDRMLLMMPFFHIGAKALENAAHWVACTVHIHDSFDPDEIFRTIEREKITVSHMAPTMIQMLLEHPDREKYDLSSLRAVLYSAAPMPTPVLRKAISAFGSIFIQMYGSTEGSGTLLPASAHRPDGDARDIRRLSSIGHPIMGVEMKVVDDNDQELPVGTPGELCFRGAPMMRGYWNNADATFDALRGGWMHTGDIAKFDEDGFLYLVDRKKDMIISGGENIYSREVEEALLAHPEIAEAAVIGIPHEKWGEAVCAVVVKTPGSQLTEDDVIAFSRGQIAGYKRPQQVHFTDKLPTLVSGKISKIDLRKIYANPKKA